MIKKTIILVMILIFYLLLGQVLDFYIPCIFNEITGLYCPGCGITRLFLSLLKLDFYQAFRYNPLVFFLIPIFIIYFILEVRNKMYGKINPMNKKSFNKVWISLAIITIIFGVLRNFDNFSFLAPTKIR